MTDGRNFTSTRIVPAIAGLLAIVLSFLGLMAVVPAHAEPTIDSVKEKVERLTNLIAIFESPALDFSKNRADGDDTRDGRRLQPESEQDHGDRSEHDPQMGQHGDEPGKANQRYCTTQCKQAAFEARKPRAYVPAKPWVAVGAAMRVLPLKVVRKLL